MTLDELGLTVVSSDVVRRVLFSIACVYSTSSRVLWWAVWRCVRRGGGQGDGGEDGGGLGGELPSASILGNIVILFVSP